jgi:hypothetical protein
MTDEQKNIAGMAHFGYIAHEYYQACKDEIIRLGELHNSTKYMARFTANRKEAKRLTKLMEEENKHLRKSLELYGKHTRAMVDKMDAFQSSDKFQNINEHLYDTFDEQIELNSTK